MSLTTVPITPGAGVSIAVDNCGAAGLVQLWKMGYSALGSSTLVQADASGLLVNVGQVQGTVAVTASAATFKVDASGANVPVVNGAGTTLAMSAAANAPVSVRLSNGTTSVDTIPISGSVSITGTPAVTISGTPTIQGTVTGDQGSAAAVAGAWPIKVTDGSNTSALQAVSGIYCVPVKVLAQTGGGYSQQDKTAYTEGTFFVEVIGGVFNDFFSADPGAGQASVARITSKRALHINLRNNSGTEIGTSSNPVAVVGATGGNLPVQGTVTAQLKDASGNAFTQSNPLYVQIAPPSMNPWRFGVTWSASQTAQVLHTPVTGKTAYVLGIVITVLTTGAGATVKIYDSTSSASTMLYQGTPPVGAIVIPFATPQPLSAINNLLKYDTGTNSTGDITVWGFDA